MFSVLGRAEWCCLPFSWHTKSFFISTQSFFRDYCLLKFLNIIIVGVDFIFSHILNPLSQSLSLFFISFVFMDNNKCVPCLHIEKWPVEMVWVDRLLAFSLETVWTAEATAAAAPGCINWYIFTILKDLQHLIRKSPGTLPCPICYLELPDHLGQELDNLRFKHWIKMGFKN